MKTVRIKTWKEMVEKYGSSCGSIITGDSTPTAAAVIAPAIPPRSPAIEKVIEFVR